MDHLNHVDRALQIIMNNRLHAKGSKCEFEKRKLKYLGNIISKEGVKVDPKKIQAILYWFPPKNIKGLT